MPIRCFDAQGLMDMDSKAQDGLLDRAAAAGFNSVTFNAPVFGEGAFCSRLGSLDATRVEAFKRLVGAMAFRRLYAFPVLWDAGSVAAFEAVGGGEAKFFSGRTQNLWQAWLLRSLAKAAALNARSGLGAWIVYRGPWPGPKTRNPSEAESGKGQAFTAPLRTWVLWQLRALRQGGATQLCGLGFFLKGDLGDAKTVQSPDLDMSKLGGPPPLAPALDKDLRLPDAKAMDHLPPLPGMTDEDAPAGAQVLTPWDLEGVDWDSVGRAAKEIPVSTGLDFMELTLDTEDWYRVGEAMASMAEKNMQTPLLWRQDWRKASRYERQKHLEAPEGMAGLEGPWPEADWPDAGESIWPVEGPPTAANVPLLFKYLEIQRDEDGHPMLGLHLNRPAELEIRWGTSWPPKKVSASKDPALVHELPLKGAKFGQQILFTARALSKRWGPAALKLRWIYLKSPPKSLPQPKRVPRAKRRQD
jgi:hypothetical protein